MRKSIDLLERGLFVCCLLFATWHVLWIATAPLTVIVRNVPDDAFYYLEISRNLGILGQSSFDGGQTLTTGYHPLWAWVSEFLGWLVHYNRMHMLREMVVISGLLSLGVALIAGRLAWRHATTTLPIITLLLTSFSFLNNSVSAVEWSLVILDSAAILLLFVRMSVVSRASAFALSSSVGLGMLGSLARSDFGGQTAAYFLAAIIVWLLTNDRRYVAPSFALLAGACSGLATAVWRDHRISGQWMQGSARMKQLWGAKWGVSPIPFSLMSIRSILYIPAQHKSIVVNLAHAPGARASHTSTVLLLASATLFTIAWVAVALIVRRVGVVLLCRVRATGSRLHLFLGISTTLMLLVYGALYSFNSIAMQAWYTADLTLAVGVLLSLCMGIAAERGKAPAVCAALAVVTLANLTAFEFSKPINYLQEGVIERAEQAKRMFGSARVGVSDAGIFNFVYGGRIINLDGLVNDEIVRYAPNRLPCYLADKHIQYITGFGESSSKAFHLEPLTEYATLIRIPLGNGEFEDFFRPDPVKIHALAECSVFDTAR